MMELSKVLLLSLTCSAPEFGDKMVEAEKELLAQGVEGERIREAYGRIAQAMLLFYVDRLGQQYGNSHTAYLLEEIETLKSKVEHFWEEIGMEG
jgi:hypothetical protein